MPSTATSILDGLSTSVAVKPACRTVALTNITLAGLQTISGYTTVENDRVLVKGQTNPVENGIYMASTGNWTRSKDADGNRDLVQGTRVLVRSSTIDGVEYELTTANPIVIGTTALTFELRYGANVTYDQTEAEILAGVTPINYAKWPSPWKDISRFVNDNTGTTDVTTQMQNAFAAEKSIVIPEGTYRISSPINIPASGNVRGVGEATRIAAYGCDAFNIPSGATLEDMVLFSNSAAGAADPKLYTAVNTQANVGQTDRIVVRNVYAQGWAVGVNLDTTWNSLIDRFETALSNVGVRLFGLSVNNKISNCNLTVSGGLASIQTVRNGIIQGEGLGISNTLMTSGTSAILSDGFLALSVDAGCIVDLCTGVAFDLTNVGAFKCDAQWVYSSAGACFHFRNPGSPFDCRASINIGHAQADGASASLFVFDTNNVGLSICGGTFAKLGATSGYPVLINGSSVSITGLHIVNATSNPGIFANGASININGTTGDRSIQWNVSQIPSAASASTLVLPTPRVEQIQIVTVTGTTNINNINDVAQWAGKTVVLKFAGILQVVDGSALKLSASYTTSADDTLTLISDGTSWYEVARSAN